MGAVAFSHTVKYVRCECSVCSIRFAFDESFYDRRHTDGKSFYCPNGHSQYYTENTKRKHEQELAQERRKTEFYKSQYKNKQRQCEQQKKKAAAYKGHLTRTKNRVKNGVCPCCNRSFVNLARHMKNKHPHYSED